MMDDDMSNATPEEREPEESPQERERDQEHKRERKELASTRAATKLYKAGRARAVSKYNKRAKYRNRKLRRGL
jgi:hypothetical protein